MRGTRLLVAALVVLVAGVGAFALGGRGDGGATDDRPDHLLTFRPGTIDAVDVRDPATGRTGRLVRGDDALHALEGDLHPLLAIRTFERRRSDYGLDPARLEATIHAGDQTVRLLVGAANFDGTGVYVAVGDRTALVLPAIGTTLGAVVGQTEATVGTGLSSTPSRR